LQEYLQINLAKELITLKLLENSIDLISFPSMPTQEFIDGDQSVVQ
jgi:hypothetical protein